MCSISDGSTLSFGAWIRHLRLLDTHQHDLGVRVTSRRGRCRAGSSRPGPRSSVSRPYASSIAAPIASNAGPVERADERVAIGHALDLARARPRARRSSQVVDRARPGRAFAVMPGGTRRLIARAAAGLDRGGRSRSRADSRCPSTVADGRAHSRSATVPSPINFDAVEHARVRAELLGEYSTPVHVCVLSSPSTTCSPPRHAATTSMRISAARASGAGPPNMPECIALPSA